MLEYRIDARRLDPHGSEATCKEALLILDTDPNGRRDAFNPAELFLASVVWSDYHADQQPRPDVIAGADTPGWEELSATCSSCSSGLKRESTPREPRFLTISAHRCAASAL